MYQIYYRSASFPWNWSIYAVLLWEEKDTIYALSCVKILARKYEPVIFLTNFLSVPEAEKYFYVAIEDTCHIGIEKHTEACYASDSFGFLSYE